MNKVKPEIMRSTVVFETPWFQVISKIVSGLNGATGQEQFFIVKPDDYVSVVAVTTDSQIILVHQYRPAVEDYTLELPSGHVEPGESPEVAVRRELLEETGYRCDKTELLGCLTPDTGRLGNRLWCYFAPDVVRADDAQPTPEEGIELVTCSLSELVEYITEGRLNHALDLAAIMMAVVKGWLPPLIASAGEAFPENEGEEKP